MGLKIWLINGILAVIAAFFGIRAFEVWGDGEKSFSELRAVGRLDAKPKAVEAQEPFAKALLPESAYEAVVSKNLFSPDRKALQSEDAAQEDGDDWENSTEGKNLLERLKEITLYGVVITDDSKAALVTTHAVPKGISAVSPRSAMMGSLPAGARSGRQGAAEGLYRGIMKPGSSPGEKIKAEWVKVGDSLSSFTVADILPDRVSLKAGSRSLDLFMYDKENPKVRAPLPKKAADKESAMGKGKEKDKPAGQEAQGEAETLQSQILKKRKDMLELRNKGLQNPQTSSDGTKSGQLPGIR